MVSLVYNRAKEVSALFQNPRVMITTEIVFQRFTSLLLWLVTWL
jgi:energy-coupling factor transporter ATP-binding protein EcfA2